MNTPICDFVRRYAESDALRLHMPGHKGTPLLGMEPLDITEIEGADSLYEAGGIIRESEHNAGVLFGANTLYSTEGSSLCIRAMLYLAALYAREKGKRPRIAAGRNAHRTFLSAAALLDLDVMWLYPTEEDSYLSCRLTARELDAILSKETDKPTAVYLTSPDYLGNITDLRDMAEVCHRHGVLLLVDNAHGAYLRFLPISRHPMDLGADMCCDSAHKTLPVLTGGAYLHISKDAPPLLAAQAKTAMGLFGSTSPSYLILQSLDTANAYLAQAYPRRLSEFLVQVQTLKEELSAQGYSLRGEEPLKLTLATKLYGYSGTAFASLLQEHHLVCEFADPDFVVMMMTPETGADGLARLKDALFAIPPKPVVSDPPPSFYPPEQVLSIREATLSPREVVPVSECIGRVLATATVSCPPAVPIVVCGERINAAAARCFAYYGIKTCTVVKQP